MTPDILYDQMIGVGAARRLVFSYGGNPGVGSLHRFRDAIEHGWPRADRDRGALARRDGQPLRGRRVRTAVRADARLRRHRPDGARTRVKRGRRARSRASSWWRCRRCDPDVAIVHAQEADREGNVQLWGIPGVQKEAVLAAERSLVTVERIVDELEPRPGGVVIPGWVIDAVAEAPGGSQPSYSLGITARDNDFYREWDALSRDRDAFAAWMDEHVIGRAPPHERRGDVQTVVAARRLSDAAVVLHRRRPAEHGGDARAHGPQPRARARLRVGHDRRQAASTSRCRSATASWPRPPTPSCRCPEMFNYWIGPGRIDVAFLGAAQVDRYANLNSTVIGDYDHPKTRLPGAGGAPEIAAGLRRGRRDRAALEAHVRRGARLRHHGRPRRRPGRARAARLPRPRPDRRHHRPRRARARPRVA